MAREKKKLLGCPACGFRVSGEEDVCSRCGARFGNQARFECPFCGEPVSPTDVRCPSCMVRFKDFTKVERRASNKNVDSLLMEIIENEAKEVKKEDKKLSCPMCSWLVDGSDESCPKCGIIFSETVAYQCPICAALISADTEKCSECGSVFLEVEEPQQMPPETMADAPGMPAAQEDLRPTLEAPPERAETSIEAKAEAPQAEHEVAPQEEPKAEPEPEQPPEEQPPEVQEEPSEEPQKARPKMIVRPKLIRKKDIAKPAPVEEETPPDKESPPEPPKRQVRRRKLKAKPKT